MKTSTKIKAGTAPITVNHNQTCVRSMRVPSGIEAVPMVEEVAGLEKGGPL